MEMAASSDYMETHSTDSDFEPINIQHVEVYEFPSDLLPVELVEHFTCKYNVESIDEDYHTLWNPSTKTYILPFMATGESLFSQTYDGRANSTFKSTKTSFFVSANHYFLQKSDFHDGKIAIFILLKLDFQPHHKC